MHIGYGRSRLFGYIVIGIFIGVLIMALHSILEFYLPNTHDWILAFLVPIFAGGMALLAYRENAVYEWGKRLDAARKHVNELMAGAAAEKRWMQALEDPSLATCWRELDCGKEDCPAFGREHARCWLIAGTFCRGEVQGQFAKKLKDCRLCTVYQQATSDPVKEITENFFAMNYLLSQREEQLQAAFTEARDRGEKLAGLVALSEAALSSVHLSEVLQNLLESAAAFAGADMGFVSLVDPTGEELGARVTYGLASGAAGELTTKVGEGILGRAFAGAYIAVSEDLTIDSRFINPYLKTLNVRTLISLPLVGREQPLGMLTLGSFSPHHYSEEEKDSLCVATDRIAAAVENTRLEAELNRDRGQIELMEAVTRDLISQDGVSSIYDSFVKHAAGIIDFDRASLILNLAETEEIEILAVSTKAPRTWLDKGLVLPKCATPAGDVIDSCRSLVRDEIHDDEYPADKLLLEEGVRSSVIIPLMSKGTVLGTVNLDSFQEHAFSREDLDLLDPVARQLGLVLDNARLLEEAKRLSLVDSLTGLFNHRYFFDAVVREISRSARHGRPVSVMLISLDGFKDFNSRHGHREGDAVLKSIALILKKNLRDIDVAARYGGDEFAVLLPELGIEEDAVSDVDAARIATRIHQAIATEVFHTEDGAELPVALSTGIAEYPGHAIDAPTVLERADWALREAKNSGDGSVVVAQRINWDNPSGSPGEDL